MLDDLILWLDTFATEDGIIPLYAKMLGLELVDYVSRGEPFGVVVRGLPGTLDEILERGYSIIHSVKNDPRVTEAQVREFFAARRAMGR